MAEAPLDPQWLTDGVVERVYADFAEHATLADVLAVVARCHTDLDTPSTAARPELVERLARQRLADRIESAAADNGPS